ncbi:acetyltransferase family protein, partial [Vibrio parahaemolyticus V-223/04]
KH